MIMTMIDIKISLVTDNDASSDVDDSDINGDAF